MDRDTNRIIWWTSHSRALDDASFHWANLLRSRAFSVGRTHTHSVWTDKHSAQWPHIHHTSSQLNHYSIWYPTTLQCTVLLVTRDCFRTGTTCTAANGYGTCVLSLLDCMPRLRGKRRAMFLFAYTRSSANVWIAIVSPLAWPKERHLLAPRGLRRGGEAVVEQCDEIMKSEMIIMHHHGSSDSVAPILRRKQIAGTHISSWWDEQCVYTHASMLGERNWNSLLVIFRLPRMHAWTTRACEYIIGVASYTMFPSCDLVANRAWILLREQPCLWSGELSTNQPTGWPWKVSKCTYLAGSVHRPFMALVWCAQPLRRRATACSAIT